MRQGAGGRGTLMTVHDDQLVGGDLFGQQMVQDSSTVAEILDRRPFIDTMAVDRRPGLVQRWG